MNGIKAIIAGLIAIFGSGAWIYFILYNWLWLGLVNSTDIGWAIGFGILFVLFIFLSLIVLGILFVLCVALATM